MNPGAAAHLSAPLAAYFGDLPGSWRAPLQGWLRSATCTALCQWVDARCRAGAQVYPPAPLRALQCVAPGEVRAVILGQDPYHGPGQAHGMAFSVPSGVRFPPSLRNLFAERERDLGCPPPASGDLGGWAAQGVLLLNAVLTVERGAPASHARQGWEAFTDEVLRVVARERRPKVFLLWGAQAQAKRALIEAKGGSSHVFCANHPSPLSARRPPVPFLGCGHFSAANQWLVAQGEAPIRWCDTEPGEQAASLPSPPLGERGVA